MKEEEKGLAEKVYNSGVAFPMCDSVDEYAADYGAGDSISSYLLVLQETNNYDNYLDSLESDGMISGENVDVGSDYTGRIVWFDEEMSLENLQVRLGDVLVDAYQIT